MSLFSNPRSIAGVSVSLLLCLPACGGEEPGKQGGSEAPVTQEDLQPQTQLTERPPVVVLGVDGLTWNVMEPLFAQGKLPNLKKLTDAGIAGNLFTDRPTFSPMLWTSIATGVKVPDHGIRYFMEIGENNKPVPGGLPYTSNSRKVPAVWNLAGENGRSVNSVAWWVSWPAEQVPNGRIVASYAAQAQAALLWKPLIMEEGLPELTYPDQLADSISDLLYDGRPTGPLMAEYNERFGITPQEWKFAFLRDRFFRGVFHADRTHEKIFMQLMEGGEIADLNLLYFGLPDVAGHYFWRYRAPQNYTYLVPDDHVKRLGDRIDRSYEQMDAWIGEVVAALPKNAIVMIVSDHGMDVANADDVTNVQSGGHDLAPPGVMILSGPGVKALGLQQRGDRTLGSIYDVTPTLLSLLGLASGSYMEGNPLRDLMTEEWKATNPALEPMDYREGFRKATRPRLPMDNANDLFLESMSALGYVTSGEEEIQKKIDGK
ncbi:MAG: alkaline phosphatase family protein [Planctomycetota bacterium]|nr:alkaline phosphatase family protein [Planctomycetota bacterium]MDA1113502.1 alkaline phosphatase family protein [Planctomycetota bacterium]